MMRRRSPRPFAVAAISLALSVGITACGSDDGASSSSPSDAATDLRDDVAADDEGAAPATAGTEATSPPASADATRPSTAESAPATDVVAAATFPITLDHALGTTTIEAQPERVVSASGTMTGHLLALDAPVVAAQVLPRQSPLSDDNGFLVQWGDVASERGVVPIAGPEVNIEAIAATSPDLIVGNAFGGDAVTDDVYALLSEIAPTIVIDHSGMQWQDLSAILADATGRQAQADAAVAAFDAHLAEVAPGLDTTHEVVAAVISPEGVNAFTPESSHGQLLESLGLTVHEISGGSLEGEAGAGSRADVMSVSPELIPDEFGDSTVLFVFAEQEGIDEALELYPTLRALPATAEGRLIALGVESFRLDAYSATAVADRLSAALG